MRLGDLDALKEQVKNLLDLAVKRVDDTPNTSPCYRMYVEQENERARLVDLIDNAQTIEQEVYMNGKDYNLYLEGYKQGKIDFERPKSEWINHRNDNGHNIADCSLCGKTTQWHDEDEDGIPRYCWYCGAEMKGGAK